MALPSSPPRHPYPAQRPSVKLVVPDVRSLSFAEARAALARAGLGAVPVYLASDDVPRGVVFRTQPAPDVIVNGTTFVEAWVSAGPEPAGGIGWVAASFGPLRVKRTGESEKLAIVKLTRPAPKRPGSTSTFC